MTQQMSPFGAITVEPSLTRPRFIDKAPMVACGLHGPEQMVEIALARADGAEVDDLGVVFFGYVGDSDERLMALHSAVERARVVHG